MKSNGTTQPPTSGALPRTSTRDNVQLVRSSGVSLARILHKFARDTTNQTTYKQGGTGPTQLMNSTSFPCVSAATVPCPVNSTSVTQEVVPVQSPGVSSETSHISHLYELTGGVVQSTPGGTSGTSKNHKGTDSSCFIVGHKQPIPSTSITQPTLQSTCLDFVPDSNCLSPLANPALLKVALNCSQFATKPRSLAQPRFSQCVVTSASNISGLADVSKQNRVANTCKTPVIGLCNRQTFASTSEGKARTTCYSTHAVSSDKESRLREERISRLKESVLLKEKDIERIRQKLLSLERDNKNASLVQGNPSSFKPTVLESGMKRPAGVQNHGSGLVSRVSKIRSQVSAKRTRLHSEKDVTVKHATHSFDTFIPNFKEKEFLQMIGLEVVVENILQRSEGMSRMS